MMPASECFPSHSFPSLCITTVVVLMWKGFWLKSGLRWGCPFLVTSIGHGSVCLSTLRSTPKRLDKSRSTTWFSLTFFSPREGGGIRDCSWPLGGREHFVVHWSCFGCGSPGWVQCSLLGRMGGLTSLLLNVGSHCYRVRGAEIPVTWHGLEFH